jgi:hypothetical protein
VVECIAYRERDASKKQSPSQQGFKIAYNVKNEDLKKKKKRKAFKEGRELCQEPGVRQVTNWILNLTSELNY